MGLGLFSPVQYSTQPSLVQTSFPTVFLKYNFLSHTGQRFLIMDITLERHAQKILYQFIGNLQIDVHIGYSHRVVFSICNDFFYRRRKIAVSLPGMETEQNLPHLIAKVHRTEQRRPFAVLSRAIDFMRHTTCAFASGAAELTDSPFFKPLLDRFQCFFVFHFLLPFLLAPWNTL